MGCAGSTEAFDLSKAYYIRPKFTTKVLGCAGGAVEDGTKIVLWEKDGSDNQKWKVSKTDDGLYSFSPLHAQDKNLDNPNLKEQCHLWAKGDGKNANQLFSMEDVPQQANAFFIKITGDVMRVLDIAESKDENGAIVYTWDDFTKADNQIFVFEAVEDAAPAPAPAPAPEPAPPAPLLEEGAQYHIVPKNAPSKVFGCAGGEGENGTKIVLWERDGSDNQKWTAQKRENDHWSFHPVHAPTQALDNPAAKEQCHLWDQGTEGNVNQRFTLKPVEGEANTFFIQTANGHLDIAESKDENGAVVYTWDEHTGADNQKFTFEKA